MNAKTGTSYNASNLNDWERAGLKEFATIYDRITRCHQTGEGHSRQGWWFFCDDDARVVYCGSFGPNNVAVACLFTCAEAYNTQEDYDNAKAKWEATPAFVTG